VHPITRAPAAVAVVLSSVWALLPGPAGETPAAIIQAPVAVAAQKADSFQLPLPTWQPHCLGFGSQWRLCDGTVLRRCSSTGAIWLHTGVDIRTGIQPVRAAANGVIVGYTVDPTFKGGVLIRHQTAQGIVLTQYWHVWPRPGFGPGKVVTKGQIFADIANMGSRTHLHFAVFRGDFTPDAWRGALPPSACDGFPAFPNHFVNATAFVKAHLPPVPAPVKAPPLHHCRTDPLGG
jgi:murein DD-endopeptidase MepM/ murein hydrolase activator NlpD